MTQLCANAIYGYTGANVNSLFSRELGDSILALGRTYFLRASQFVSTNYPQLKVRHDLYGVLGLPPSLSLNLLPSPVSTYINTVCLW